MIPSLSDRFLVVEITGRSQENLVPFYKNMLYDCDVIVGREEGISWDSANKLWRNVERSSVGRE